MAATDELPAASEASQGTEIIKHTRATLVASL